jgi:glycosyltransferase involved in cell wall biosynthesis
MRVLTLTNLYPPHFYGGYELTCQDVMDRFRGAGHDVHVLTSTARVPGVIDVEEPDVRRTLRAYWDWQSNRPVVARNPLARLQVERHNLRELATALDGHRPDLVSVWHFGALSLSMLSAIGDRGLPMVVTVANEWLIHATVLDGWSRLWRRLPLRPATVAGVPTRPPPPPNGPVNFVSDFTKAQTVTAGGLWPVDDAVVINPGIDVRDFPISRAEAADPWSWRILYVGRMDQPKGLETLLLAFARLPVQARLELVGGGDVGYQRRLRDFAAGLGISDRVTMHALPRDRIRERYLDSDVVVFPSTWDEPFGLVPLEAMACARPVVATGRGGSATFLRDGGNCLLFPAQDPSALADALRSLAADAALRRALVTEGVKTAAHFTADRYADELMRLHEQALALRGTGPAAG